MRFAFMLCALLPLATLADDARVRELEYLGYAAVTADMVTTHIAVHDLGMEEGNPLLGKRPDDALVFAGGVVRYALIYAVAHGGAPDRTKRIALTVLDCVSLGVVGNNISAITHRDVAAAPAIGIGVSVPLAVDFRWP